MKNIQKLISGILCLLTISLHSQIENVRIETYYISDASDYTDTLGGHLGIGSTTYRIYIDLTSGSRLIGIYGDQIHPMIFNSTSPFFNHAEDGVTFGKDMNRTRYQNGTVPLDSYITIGQCSKPFAQGAYFGIVKEKDTDGSIIGGPNNDGGSELIAGGLLVNSNPNAGIPLIKADGLYDSTQLPGSWIDVGFKEPLSGIDTSVFGNTSKLSFFSEEALLRNSGVQGFDTSNEVLIAQLTTKGELSFEINVEVQQWYNGVWKTIKYVARNEGLLPDEIFEPLLKYPYVCGCTNPDYLEANTTFACSDSSKCLTLIQYGCMDSLACNYDPKSNFHIDELCCYIGFCHDLDLSVVCPNLIPRVGEEENLFSIFPNPCHNDINIKSSVFTYPELSYVIYDIFGLRVLDGNWKSSEGAISLSVLGSGNYYIQLISKDFKQTIPFFKL